MSTSSEIPAMHPDKVSPGYIKYDIIASMLTFVATLCVVLRFVHRSHANDYRWDDWAALASIFFSIGLLIILLLISAPRIAGAGYHIDAYTVPQLSNYMKLALSYNVLYNFSVASSKASIVFFYYRFFSIDTHFKIFMRIILALIIGNCLICALGLIFSDSPVEAQWNVGMPYTSINNTAFWAAMAVVNIILDVLILGIAQFKVWKLHISTRRKVLVSLVFILGAFTIITSILRIIYLLMVDVADLTYTSTTAGIWTNVEVNLSIICACAPVIYSLVRFKVSGNRSTASNSFRPMNRSKSAIITIGGGNSYFKRCQDEEDEVGLSRSSAYRTIAEADGGTHSLEPLDVIRVQRAFHVT